MICYRCGSTLGSGRHCLHCGADVTAYRKIVKQSNAWYNAGLERARVRDLSGAIEALTRSLQFDRRNIQARNLLGLVWYEMGEVVEALSQWVISKNLQPEDNPADHYISSVRGNSRELENMNQAIVKYNQALDSAKHDGEDLAVIQLKSVISLNPHLMKAYQLLALLYIHDEEYTKAARILKKALQIDKGNVLCQKYAAELKGKTRGARDRKPYTPERSSEFLSQEVIIPEQKELKGFVRFGMGVALTAAVCGLLFVFLLKPSIMKNQNNRVNQIQITYDEKLGDRDSLISKLTNERDALQAEVDQDNKILDTYTGENGTLTNYNRLITALEKYTAGKWYELMDAFSKIDPDVVEAEEFQACYNTLGEFVNGDEILNKIMQEAVSYYNAGKYQSTRSVCATILELNPDYVNAIYYMAMAYEASGDDRSAAPYFQDIVNRFPNSEYYAPAKRRVS